MSNFWDQRYQQYDRVYGEKPNDFFKETLDRVQTNGKRLLLVAEGEGRNAIYAARKGWEVYAFDASEVAKNKALDWAKREQIPLTYETQSYEALTLPPQQFDVAGMIYAHMPTNIRHRVHEKIIDSLLPGGLILLEVFEKEQLGASSGGPKILDMLYDIKSIEREFIGMEMLELSKEKIILDEGSFHQGEATVIRMIAKKLS